jgi:hypothetical protein
MFIIVIIQTTVAITITITMSSVVPLRAEFDKLLTHVKDSRNMEELLSNNTPYDIKKAHPSFVPCH